MILTNIQLFCSRKGELLIPESWGKLYLPQWAKFLGVVRGDEHVTFRELLCSLAVQFCKMIVANEDTPRAWDEEVPEELLQHRCIDLLVIILVNVGMVRPKSRKYQELFNECQSVRKTFRAGGRLHWLHNCYDC